MAIIITSSIPGVSYGAFLSQTEAKPFKVKKTSIISPTNAQVEQSTAVTYKDANGNRVDHVFTPTIDPYQELIGRIDDDFEYTFDGFTNIRFNQIAGNTTVVLKVYPGKRFDATNTLEGKPALLEIPGDVPYVFSIQNTGSAAVSNVDFGDAYTVITQNALKTITSGTYTPTLTNLFNISASTPEVCNYSRVGDIVTVSGVVFIDQTTGGQFTELGISLPISSTLTSAIQCSGAGYSTAADQPSQITGDGTLPVNGRAVLTYVSNGILTNQAHSFIFTYKVN